MGATQGCLCPAVATGQGLCGLLSPPANPRQLAYKSARLLALPGQLAQNYARLGKCAHSSNLHHRLSTRRTARRADRWLARPDGIAQRHADTGEGSTAAAASTTGSGSAGSSSSSVSLSGLKIFLSLNASLPLR
mmetsp:Transcript_8703/g.34291  ORF Transcript_8703/g.34291 Transcript_8703/m.34291 type:complete len:134 (-) Transcript_8703:523-924(-)